MIKLLLYKWFGLQSESCSTCEVLRDQLVHSENERRELLTRLLDKAKPDPVIPEVKEEFVPIMPQHVPWRVRQQMMEAEDRKTAQLLKQSAKEIDDLEKEVGIK